MKQKRFLIRLSQDKDKYDETIKKFDILKALNGRNMERVYYVSNGDKISSEVWSHDDAKEIFKQPIFLSFVFPYELRNYRLAMYKIP